MRINRDVGDDRDRPAIRLDPFGEPDINPGGRDGPYVNWCQACGWTGAVALWYGDARDHADGKPPHCPECERPNVVHHRIANKCP